MSAGVVAEEAADRVCGFVGAMRFAFYAFVLAGRIVVGDAFAVFAFLVRVAVREFGPVEAAVVVE